jgi:hypothetical protein
VWNKTGTPDDSIDTMNAYLQALFSYSRKLTIESRETRKTTDVLGGSLFTANGGAMIIDVAINGDTGETIVMLARGSTPASEIYLIQNPTESAWGAWLPVTPGGGIYLEDTSYILADMLEFN